MSNKFPPVPKRCAVTGSSGFVGQRLVEMLIERGAEKVIAFDILPKPHDAIKTSKVQYVKGDIRDKKAVNDICKDIDCIWHNAAAVGPYHPQKLYDEVNYQGTLNVIEACKKNKVGKIVMSSSPSTRFTGEDVNGLSEDELPQLPLDSYLQAYASSKAKGEMAMSAACCDELMTIAVAPHQVYGPRDTIFLPNLLEAAGTGRFRVFGGGKNRICFTHVDNYCHGLIIAERALYKKSPALGKFYIVTDGDTHDFKEGYCLFYDSMETAITKMGFPSIKAKMSIPYWVLMPLAYICLFVTRLTGIQIKLTPFAVRMLTMHRWFKIDKAINDLNYKPIKSFQEEWPKTIEWFKQNWLPKFQSSNQSMLGLYSRTQEKINIQAGKSN